MSLKLEGMRTQCARRIYEDMEGAVPGRSPNWFQLPRKVRQGYEKMAGCVFDELFRKPPEDLFEFFADRDITHFKEDVAKATRHSTEMLIRDEIRKEFKDRAKS